MTLSGCIAGKNITPEETSSKRGENNKKSSLSLSVPEFCTEIDIDNRCVNPSTTFSIDDLKATYFVDGVKVVSDDLEMIIVSIELNDFQEGELIDFNWDYVKENGVAQREYFIKDMAYDGENEVVIAGLHKPDLGWKKGTYRLTINTFLPKEEPPFSASENEPNPNIEPIVMEIEIK